MSHELVEEVLDHAPVMTPAEGLVLVAIAEEMRRPGETRDISSATMVRRTRGMTPSGIRKALERLAERGIEVRVPLSDKSGRPLYGRDGRALYAVPGRVPTYRLPHFPPPADCDCERCTKAGPQSPLNGEPQVRRGGTTVPPSEGGTRGRSGGTAGRSGGTRGRSGGTAVPPTPFHGRDVVPPHAMPDAAAATLRAASPPGKDQSLHSATAQEGATLSVAARDEIAAARARLRPKGAPASRWTSFRAAITEPKDAASNPHHDPGAAVRAREMAEALPDLPAEFHQAGPVTS